MATDLRLFESNAAAEITNGLCIATWNRIRKVALTANKCGRQGKQAGRAGRAWQAWQARQAGQAGQAEQAMWAALSFF